MSTLFSGKLDGADSSWSIAFPAAPLSKYAELVRNHVPDVRGLIVIFSSFVGSPLILFRRWTAWLVDNISGPLQALKIAVKNDTSAESEWNAMSDRRHCICLDDIPMADNPFLRSACGRVGIGDGSSAFDRGY